MYAIEFETNITNPYIEIQDYKKFLHRHAKVIILIDDSISQTINRGLAQRLKYQNLLDKHHNNLQINTSINIDAIANEVNA